MHYCSQGEGNWCTRLLSGEQNKTGASLFLGERNMCIVPHPADPILQTPLEILKNHGRPLKTDSLLLRTSRAAMRSQHLLQDIWSITSTQPCGLTNTEVSEL